MCCSVRGRSGASGTAGRGAGSNHPRISLARPWLRRRGWLSSFRSRAPRRPDGSAAADGLGATVHVIRGSPHSGALGGSKGFYRDTVDKKWSTSVPSGLFQNYRERLAPITVALLAEVEEMRRCPGVQREALFGRYWGCRRALSRCTSRSATTGRSSCAFNRLDPLEAGAQRYHKVKRELLPAAIHSLHNRHGTRRRRGAPCRKKRSSPRADRAAGQHGPFRRD